MKPVKLGWESWEVGIEDEQGVFRKETPTGPLIHIAEGIRNHSEAGRLGTGEDGAGGLESLWRLGAGEAERVQGLEAGEAGG